MTDPATELFVLLDGRLAARVTRTAGRLRLVYDPEWRAAKDSYPVSLSMPLTADIHDHGPVNAFIWGLLPDNELTLNRWARAFQVSARNPFALIAAVGEDCAGAVQFVTPARFEAMMGETTGGVDWLSEQEVGKRLRSVLEDSGSGRTTADNGQFSLAGAQPKTALLRDGDRWGVPYGRVPTTHILKPPLPALPGHAENEHLCLRLARALGLRAARSEVAQFDGQPAIVVTRYDRLEVAEGPDYPDIARVHQEDICQALGIEPGWKYENDRGPGAIAILGLIQESVTDPFGADLIDGAIDQDMARFLDALLFNWLIGGTDAHAKNYSFLIAEDTVRLAPLYDIASAYGLPDSQPQRMKLAMRVDGPYHVERILLRHWHAWAPEAGFDGERVVARARDLAQRLPDELARIAADMRGHGLTHPVVERIERALTSRALAVSKQ